MGMYILVCRMSNISHILSSGSALSPTTSTMLFLVKEVRLNASFLIVSVTQSVRMFDN